MSRFVPENFALLSNMEAETFDIGEYSIARAAHGDDLVASLRSARQFRGLEIEPTV